MNPQYSSVNQPATQPPSPQPVPPAPAAPVAASPANFRGPSGALTPETLETVTKTMLTLPFCRPADGMLLTMQTFL